MSEDRIPIFCYHGIGGQRKYDVEKESFQRQIKWLDENYSLLTVSEIYRKKDNNELPEKPAALTFDDGLKSAFDARGFLNDRDIKATFYIVSGILGELWEGEKVIQTEELKKLSEEGHEIGSHTVSHPFLTELGEENIEKEVVNSINKLENIIGKEIQTFAYPYGDFNQKVEGVLEETDIETALTTEPKCVRGFQRPLRTPRLTVLGSHDISHVKRMANGKNHFHRNYWHFALKSVKDKSLRHSFENLI